MKALKPALRTLVLVALAGYVVAAQQPAAPAATATPASVGISTERLGRLHAGMQAFIDRKEAAGIVTLIAREGKVVDVHATGYLNVAAATPMRADSMFRIASMTKPVTSVALMMLYEEGKLLLTDPVSKFIPAFKNSRVLEGAAEPVPARRGINLRDLLTHRSGITYGFINAGPVGAGYRKNGVTDGLTVATMTLAEAIDKLAAEPLIAHPGAAWNYSLASDVLGRVVEVASGMPFQVFMRDRIFKPLRMTDTDFVVPESKWPRVASVYAPDRAGGIRPMTDPETFGNTVMSPIASYKEDKTYFSGGAGLVSTARDYWRFAQMLLNGGVLEGARLLSPKTVELMTASHTSDLPPGSIGAGSQFGLGFRVVTDIGATQTLGSNGSYGWSGIYGTNFWVDPKERLVAIVLVQRYPGSPVASAFTPLVYQALIR
ncbi:MAG: serine hydrolase domain-containing protein [Vicinamibacterales bacterium]